MSAANGGATNWPPPAYSPDTGLLYVPTSETYAMYYLSETDPRGAMGLGGKEEIGVVTSGTHSPTLKKAIGLAYLPLDKSAPGTEFMVLIRGKETRARVVPTPFYKRK